MKFPMMLTGPAIMALRLHSKAPVSLSKMSSWLISQGPDFTELVLYPHAWPQGLPYFGKCNLSRNYLVFQ